MPPISQRSEKAMRNPFLFFSDLLKQPRWVAIWVALLAIVNMASLLFWSDPIARIVFVAFILSSMMMMALYAYFGFEKILGLGHVLWLFLLPYILFHLGQADGSFSLYLRILAVFLAISLVFDVVDVWKYFREKVVKAA